MSLATLENYVQSVERYQPNETHESLLDVDFAAHVRAGRTTLVLDAESTFVEFDGWDVEPSIVNKLVEARRHGMERIIITTNKRPKDELDLWQLQWWTEQIDADLVIVPLAKEQRKPSPHLLLAVMEAFEVPAESMLMIGDKLSSDVAAANEVGVYSVWVQRWGQPDHWGDRLGRRPLERGLAKVALNGAQAPTAHQPKHYKHPATLPVQPRQIQLPGYLQRHSRIAGYGQPAIELSPDKLAQIQPAYPANCARRLPPCNQIGSTSLWPSTVAWWPTSPPMLVWVWVA